MTDSDFTAYLLARGLSSRSVAIYLATLRRARVVADALELDLERLNPLEARALSEAWPGGRSSRTQLRSTLGHLWGALGRLDAPVRAVRVPRHPRYRCRALSDRDAALLAAAARARRDPKGLAVLFGLYGAMRRAEIAGVRAVDLRDGWIHVQGKGDVEREFPLHPVLRDALAETRGLGERFLFPGRFGRGASPATIWSWTREVAASVGLVVRPHELRHTALATAHDATGDLRTTAAFAGHMNLQTTAIYTRTTAARLTALVHAIDYRGGEPA